MSDPMCFTPGVEAKKTNMDRRFSDTTFTIKHLFIPTQSIQNDSEPIKV